MESNANLAKQQSLNILIQQSIDILETGFLWREPQDIQGSDISEQRDISLSHISRDIYLCQQCELCKLRKQAVPGMGALHPLLMIVGEAPGANEDKEGLPFVGESGKYLDKWLASIGLSRQKDVYITNTVKCRPPNNRDPHSEELEACAHFLNKQISILKPKLLLALGRIAGQILTGNTAATLHSMRTQEFVYENIPLFVTYHPSAVLRNSHGLKRLVWEDLQKIQKRLKE